MAEALGIAGSIAGLASIADAVFRLVFKNAKADVLRLAEETQSIAGLLLRLALLACGFQDDDSQHESTLRLHHVISY